jgi:hypothetical protein
MTGDPMSTTPPADDASPEEIERDIDQVRTDLGETVDELTARLDPRIRAREAAERAKATVRRVPAAVVAAAAAALILTAVTLRRRR